MPAATHSRTTIRRRRRSAGPVSKVTFSLHSDVVNAIKRAVSEGRAANASAFAEAAIRDHLRRARREALHEAYAQAAQDPAFLEDVQDTTRAFDPATGDGLSDAHR